MPWMSEPRRALITGIGGQDGSLLAELLLAEGYDVYGTTRRPALAYSNLVSIADQLSIVDANLLDQRALERVLREAQPDEVYNLASVSFVPSSWRQPSETAELAAVGVTTMLEAIRAVAPETRLYQASSSEIFGEPRSVPQDEETPLSPVTPYGVAKAYGHFITRSYRHRYGLHASSGILYNHESPRRPPEFLPRKVSLAVARIKHGVEQHLTIGDLDARRDWGFAGDYVRAMWLMLQQNEPDDYVIATGSTHSVRELVDLAFNHVGLEAQDHIRTDSTLRRGKAELRDLVGNASKARERLGWVPVLRFEELIEMLVDADLDALGGTAYDAKSASRAGH
jgi:GDPmannose 4,6-dehydratase